ncbi:AAA family ATPase [Paenibacillus kribbensis]|uniref:AAA family ATPase n=1 Tax=Paenibacillus kribbensis TaxID=172713 RepID=UPI002DBBBA61|nr:AAA family ATPase [Paenibacillus kribbensis]MEC0234439.1 AAA family ATPase [Paenibacillus kribbensis]
MKETQRVAAALIALLKKEDFTIQRYDSVTTSSIYLKLDYGVCHSVRIGDHKGKRQYKYRYNVDIGRRQINRHKTAEGWPRWYYPETELRALVRDVVRERQQLQKYGTENYWALMVQRKFESSGAKGFWESSYLVNEVNKEEKDVEYEINQKARDALNRLTSLPGMQAIKEQVEEMVQFSRIAALRKKSRLKTQIQSNHMIFTGNPGTGKTTAARLIGEAFAEIGLLKRQGDRIPFVEINQSTIVDSLVGASEKKVASKFKEARGGVLFIDEAYAFLGKADHRSDEKVIATMVQHIEDLRDEVVVIAAGYPKNMQEFLSFNPGLASRFPTTIHFPDYAVPELVRIAQQMLLDQQYQAGADYLDALASTMWVEKSKPNFGNARTVRNHIERSIRKQSMRVSQLPNPSRKDLATLTAVDLIHSAEGLRDAEQESLRRIIKDAQWRLFELDLKTITHTSKMGE